MIVNTVIVTEKRTDTDEKETVTVTDVIGIGIVMEIETGAAGIAMMIVIARDTRPQLPADTAGIETETVIVTPTADENTMIDV